MCCSGFLKMMMFIFNGGIFLAGVTIMGVGIWVKVDSGSLLGLLDEVEDLPAGVSQLVNVSYLLIAVGAVLLVIGFLGCCGAIRESRCMLLTFFIILLIIFLAEVAGAVVLFVFQDVARDLFEELDESIKKSLREHYGQENSMTSLWNATMNDLQCCGFKGFTDFNGSIFTNSGGLYPQPCCNGMAPCNIEMAEYAMVPGCFDRLVELLEQNAMIIAAVALGITALEIAAMVVSMVLYQQIGSKRR